uniref:Uncharacterized protein n=1 Tax=Plectus sambesii TaxID=2011161 RepID=A0A914W8C5_9BILA
MSVVNSTETLEKYEWRFGVTADSSNPEDIGKAFVQLTLTTNGSAAQCKDRLQRLLQCRAHLRNLCGRQRQCFAIKTIYTLTRSGRGDAASRNRDTLDIASEQVSNNRLTVEQIKADK